MVEPLQECEECSSEAGPGGFLQEKKAQTGPKVRHRTSWGILPQTPVFSLRSARCHWYSSTTALTENPPPKDLLVSHRTSWGILPQTPVFLRSARCPWFSSTTALTGHPPPKDLLVSHRTSWGILPQTPVTSLRSAHFHWYSSIIAA
jgi:hypothetical protein